MQTTIAVINGPNLNRLGLREPHIYGKGTLSGLEGNLKKMESEMDVRLYFGQSNHEGDLIDWIHEAASKADGIVLNAGAFTHYSYAIRDAIASVDIPVIEVHISNVFAREPFREKSVIAPVVKGHISGLGLEGYELAVRALYALKNRGNEDEQS
jgi:3-dehydroquinate dehydratase-2